jgi:hypothetical protein
VTREKKRRVVGGQKKENGRRDSKDNNRVGEGREEAQGTGEQKEGRPYLYRGYLKTNVRVTFFSS